MGDAGVVLFGNIYEGLVKHPHESIEQLIRYWLAWSSGKELGDWVADFWAKVQLFGEEKIAKEGVEDVAEKVLKKWKPDVGHSFKNS